MIRDLDHEKSSTRERARGRGEKPDAERDERDGTGRAGEWGGRSRRRYCESRKEGRSAEINFKKRKKSGDWSTLEKSKVKAKSFREEYKGDCRWGLGDCFRRAQKSGKGKQLGKGTGGGQWTVS